MAREERRNLGRWIVWVDNKVFQRGQRSALSDAADKSGKMRTGLTTGVSNTAITDHFGKSGFAGAVWA